ncbi:MAG: hypothetical protein AABW83_01835 [Nanoarchaeota archaeon]
MKIIYNGDNNDFYDKESFINFLSRLKDIELISHDILHPTKYSGNRKSEVWTYYSPPHEVTLQYRHIATERIISEKEVYISKVTIFGRIDKIWGIEKLISDADSKHNNEKAKEVEPLIL